MNTGQKTTWAITTRVTLLLLLSGGAAEADLSSRPAGTVVAWGADGWDFGWDFGQSKVPEGLNDVVAIAAGRGFSLALRKNGTVAAWGDNRKGQCRVPDGLDNVVAIEAGKYDHSLALKSDGTVVAWGENHRGQSTVPEGLQDVVAIAGATSTSFAVKSEGTVVAWGFSTEIPSNLEAVNAVAVGFEHALALMKDGALAGWWLHDGTDYDLGPVYGSSDVVAIAAGSYFSLALFQDGGVYAWGGPNEDGELNVPHSAWSGVTAIAAGGHHCLALKEDGTVVAWGRGESGKSRPYDVGQSIVPGDLRNVVAVAAGSFHSLALVAVTVPALAVQHVGTQLRLSWPESESDYQLEMTEDLSDPSSWVVAPTVPTLVDSEHVVTLDPMSGNRFYRLTRE